MAPIAALATPRGQSALALIRVSGEGSLALLASCFSRPRALREARGHAAVYGWIDGGADGGGKIDQVLVLVFREPRSFTGEEGADICCHGGRAAPDAVLRLLVSRGFRPALPGEFSFRAFLNGKIDLSRAEAVMELVGSQTDAAREGAVRRLCGALEAEINAIKALLLTASAEVELLLDYSEVDGIGLDRDTGENLPARGAVTEALTRLDRLLAMYQTHKLEQQGALVALAGKPNTGKSSLFNLLLKEERSIVTARPGTTRDWIEGWAQMAGVRVRLADTAGLREAGDEVEKIGVERSRALLAAADLVVYLLDGEDIEAALPRGERVLFAWNKCDVTPMPRDFRPRGEPCFEVSAKSGAGSAELCAAVALRLRETAGANGSAWTLSGGGACPGTERQKALVARAAEALRTMLSEAESAPLDIAALRLREALDALGGITGEVSSADVLEALFGTFCVGK
jgi:tRNA modification GTPase